eukprot:TCONS_00062959-protein
MAEVKFSAANDAAEVKLESKNKNGGEMNLEEDDNKQPERRQWGNKFEFLLSCIGYAVGLGNIWRFPWLAKKNGGGAFLIPYFTMLILEGIPVFYLEMNIGQRFRLGPGPVWQKISPWAGGVGLCTLAASFLSGCFYRMPFGWIIYYFFTSMQNPLPWSSCPQVSDGNSTMVDLPKCKKIGSTEYYWYYTALQISSSIEDNTGLSWQLVLSLFGCYTIITACMIKGIESAGKVVYFTALFPYVCLLIFLIQGLTLEGYEEGLYYLFRPEWDRLKDPIVWKDAAAQIFFSLSLGFGGIIAYASYNDEKNDTLKDTLIICFVNCFTSIFAGCAIFSILGYRATTKSKNCILENLLNSSNMWHNCSVDYFLDQTSGGSGLAFVAFTEAIDLLPGSIFFAILFFLMLVTLGLDSAFGSLEGVLTSVIDMKIFPKLRDEWKMVTIALIMFIPGIAFCTSIGEYLIQLFSDFGIDFPIIIVAFAELMFVSYAYGLDKFGEDIEHMTGRNISLFFKICWKYVSPALIAIVLGFTFYGMVSKPPQYTAWDTEQALSVKKDYPGWALFVGVTCTLLTFICIPGYALWVVYKRRYKGEKHTINY